MPVPYLSKWWDQLGTFEGINTFLLMSCLLPFHLRGRIRSTSIISVRIHRNRNTRVRFYILPSGLFISL